jgi:hypothetical protein
LIFIQPFFKFWFILNYIYIDENFVVQIAAASKMYTELDKEKKSFTLIHCYDILKGEDKWAAKRIELAELEKQAKKIQKPTKTSRPRDEVATINEGTIDVDAEQTEPRKRSDGIKKSKQILRRGGAAELCVEAIEKMWAKKEPLDKEKEKAKEERFKQTIELDKAAIEVDKERASNEAKLAEAKLMKEEKEIMQVDKSKLDSVQLEYYEIMQRKIIARRLAN